MSARHRTPQTRRNYVYGHGGLQRVGSAQRVGGAGAFGRTPPAYSNILPRHDGREAKTQGTIFSSNAERAGRVQCAVSIQRMSAHMAAPAILRRSRFGTFDIQRNRWSSPCAEMSVLREYTASTQWVLCRYRGTDDLSIRLAISELLAGHPGITPSVLWQ